jgi:hypothetical protein
MYAPSKTWESSLLALALEAVESPIHLHTATRASAAGVWAPSRAEPAPVTTAAASAKAPTIAALRVMTSPSSASVGPAR